MVHVGTVLAAIREAVMVEHVDAERRLHELGLDPVRCCESCTFEALSARALVAHRVRCDAYMYEYAAGTASEPI